MAEQTVELYTGSATGTQIDNAAAKVAAMEETLSGTAATIPSSAAVKNYVDGKAVDTESTLLGNAVYDISEANNGTTYANLAAALNNGNNIPASIRKGGISIKFIQSSDNKYVQYFLTKDEWSASEDDWEKMVLEEEVSLLQHKVTDLELLSGSYTQALARVYDHPEEWCFLLNQPGTGIRKPIWHIGNGVFIDAAGAVISFEVTTPATPTFSPDGGSVLEGTVITLACATPDADIYVSTDDGETYTKTSTVTISEAVTLMAYSELEDIRSSVVSKAFTIAIDHRFKFTVKLDQDNATVYVPVAAGTIYTMEVDWGDGSTPDTYNNQLIGPKNCKHTYSGLAGDTFQITLRGSAIPKLYFWQQNCFTLAQLYSIDDNTLDVSTDFSFNGIISLDGCTNLVSLADNSFSNALSKDGLKFKSCSSLSTLSMGLLSMFAEGGISNVDSMFYGCTALELSSEFMASLRTKLSSSIKSVFGMFYNCKGNITIPDNFFDNLAADTVSDFRAMTTNATGVHGDAKALYDVLVTKATSSAQTTGCFSGTNLTNRNQVPTAWGGTMTV